jgi:hypothetical protein
MLRRRDVKGSNRREGAEADTAENSGMMAVRLADTIAQCGNMHVAKFLGHILQTEISVGTIRYGKVAD